MGNMPVTVPAGSVVKMKWVMDVACLEPCLAQSAVSLACGSDHCHLYSRLHQQHHVLVPTTITLTVIIVAAILGQVLVDDADCQGR